MGSKGQNKEISKCCETEALGNEWAGKASSRR